MRLDAGRRNALTLDAVEALAAGARERETLLAAMGELLFAVLSGPTRVVAACAGHAVAAGAMLLLAADVRLAARGDYQVGFTEPRLGMPLPELPLLLARERLDRRRLHELTVLGRTLDPEAAAAAGFVDRVVDADALDTEALRAAHERAALDDAAYHGTLATLWGPVLARMHTLVAEQARRRDATRA